MPRGVRAVGSSRWRATPTTPRSASATRSTWSTSSASRTELRRAGRQPARAACARSTTSARRRSRSTPPRSSTTASAAAQGGDAFTFVQETEGLDFNGALESSPTATASRSSSRRRTRGAPSGASARERLLELLERTATFYVRHLWESDEAAPRARVPRRARARGGDAARVPRRLRAERVGQGAARVAPRGLQQPRALRRRPRPAAARADGPDLRPLPPADHVPAVPTAAGACSASARARWAPTRSRSTSTRPRASVFHKGRQLFGADLARGARGARRASVDRRRGLHRRHRAAPGRAAQRRRASWARR